MSRCQAEELIPVLNKSGKDLCFINIAGGSASDSINTLFFLIEKESSSLLKNRRIEINVLDIDEYGPAFAEQCIKALKLQGNKFEGLNISLRHIHYDWNNARKLSDLLSERKGWLQICSSEGGLFEYCSDNVIMQNLNILYENSSEDIIIAGSLIHDIDKVDAGIIAALKIS